MSRRRMVVAYESVETPQDRLYQEMMTGELLPMERRRRPPGKGVFWCAADRPEESDQLRLRPVYRTNRVPEFAQCEVCFIEIAALQKAMA